MENRKPTYNQDDIPDFSQLENQGWQAMRQMLDEHMPLTKEKPRVIPMYWRWMAAAVVLLLVGVVGYHFLTGNNSGGNQISDMANSVNRQAKDSNTSSIAANNGIDTSFLGKGNHPKSDTQIIASSIAVAGTRFSNAGRASRSGQSFGHQKTDFPNDAMAGYNDITASTNTNVNRHNGLVTDQTSAGITTGYQSGAVTSLGDNKEKGNAAIASNSAQLNSIVSTETLQKKITLEPVTQTDMAKSVNSLANKSINKENVEAASRFRQNANEALWAQEKSDSTKHFELAKAKKTQSDSQLTANRRQQLEEYFGDKEGKENGQHTAGHKAKVDLAVLANRNITSGATPNGGSLYSLPIYPAVNASVKVSNHIGFTTGISTASPGNFSNSANGGNSNVFASASSGAYSFFPNTTVNKSTNSNAFISPNSSFTSEDVNLGSNNTQIQQAYYWQIPVLFDYYVGNTKLKLSAGTDFSIIQKVLVGNGANSQLLGGDAFNNANGLYRVRNFDPRMSFGAQYRINNLLLGARFSRSFQPAFQYNGVSINGGNNQVFNFSIGYSFWK